jgi:hypothetical protein
MSASIAAGKLFDEEVRPHATVADFLVSHQDQHGVAGGPEALARQRRQPDRRRCDLALHVHRAATPDHAVALDAAVGLDRPVLAARHDHVEVAQEPERGPGPRPGAT